MTKIVDFDDGFTSATEPTTEGATASFYSPYANNAAYEAVHTAVAGSVFLDTTLDVVKVYDGTTWRTTERALDNVTTSDPVASNDNTEGYELLSLWLNTSSGAFFRATDVSTGAAVWQEVAADSVLDSHISATTAHGATGAVVGTTNTQTLTTKTFDDEITLQEVATPSTPASGYMKVYPKVDGKMYKLDDTGAESEMGGGGGGSLEIFYQDDYGTNTKALFSVTGDSATPDNAGTGTMSGSLLNDTVSPIAGDRAIQFLSSGAGANDFFLSDTIALDDTQNGRDVGVVVFYSYGTVGAADGDMKFLMHDATNDVVISSDLDLLDATDSTSDTKRFSTSVFIPKDCTSIRYGFQRVAGTSKVLEWSNVEFSTNPFVYKQIIDDYIIVHGSDNGGESLTANVTDIPFAEVSDSYGAWNGSSFTVPKSGAFSISGSVIITTNLTSKVQLYVDGVLEESLHTKFTTGTVYEFSCSREFLKDEVVSLRLANNATLDSVNLQFHYIHIVGYPTTSEHVVTPAKSNINSIALEGNAGEAITANTENVVFNGSGTGWDGGAYTYTMQKNNSILQLHGMISDTGPVSFGIDIYIDAVFYRTVLYSRSTYLTGSKEFSYIGTSGEFSKDAVVSLRVNSGMTLSNTSGRHYLNIVESGDATFLAAIPVQKVAFVKDVKAEGTQGGTFTSGSWITRDLTTVYGDSEIVSLSANQFTLAAGKYIIEGQAPALQCNTHMARVYNITDSSLAFNGSSAYGSSGAVAQNNSVFGGTITITVSTTFEIQHQAQTTAATNGLGQTSTFTSGDEVYTQVKITKLR